MQATVRSVRAGSVPQRSGTGISSHQRSLTVQRNRRSRALRLKQLGEHRREIQIVVPKVGRAQRRYTPGPPWLFKGDGGYREWPLSPRSRISGDDGGGVAARKRQQKGLKEASGPSLRCLDAMKERGLRSL